MTTWVKKETIGEHVLYLGDCLEVMPELTEMDVVITDPPYGVGLTGKTQLLKAKTVKQHKPSALYDDNEKYIRTLIIKSIPLSLKLTKRGAVFTGNRIFDAYPKPLSVGCVFEPAGAGLDPWGFTTTSMIFYYGKDPYLQKGLGSRPNGFKGNASASEDFGHPSTKPLYWMEWIVERTSLFDETVLDPFMGSGTTGVACEKLGRKFIGIEKVPKFFDIACKRIEEAVRHPTFKLKGKIQQTKRKSIFAEQNNDK